MPENVKIESHLVYLGLGSNIAPETNLKHALTLLGDTVQVIAVSKVWKTQAVGTEGPDFLNAAIAIRTKLPPDELKIRVLREIERQLGRVRTEDKNAPRPIDIDILIFDSELSDPQIWSQVHLAVPLAELIPNYIHRENGETLAQVARRLLLSTPINIKPGVLTDSNF
jgi:2-amino-4-hydroxy-6-hydroxymethyldihydropteridine diphosphokinase